MSYAREYAITYGSITVGGTSSTYLLTDVHVVRVGFLVAEVRFTFECVATTATAFGAACRAAERAFSDPDRNLRVRLGASTILDMSQDANTGLDAMPVIEKVEEPDGGRCRKYTVRIELGMPAARANISGLRRTSVNLSFTPSRKKSVVIEGEFTAAGNETARERYEAEIEALADAATTDIGGTFELVDESAAHSTNNKSILFRRMYEEVIFSEGGGGLDDASIVRQEFEIADEQTNAGWMHKDASPLFFTTVRWQAWIDRTSTTDLEGKWRSVRSWVISQAASVAAGQIAVVTTVRPEFDYAQNRIAAHVTVASNLRERISYNLVVRDERDEGVVLVPVWKEGTRLAYYDYPGPAVVQRVVEEEYIAARIVSRADAEAAHAKNCDFAKSSFPNVQGLTGTPQLVWIALPAQLEVEELQLGVESETAYTRVRARSAFQAIERVQEYVT